MQKQSERDLIETLRSSVEEELKKRMRREKTVLIGEAEAYSLLGGGKRIRPVLFLLTVLSLSGRVSETALSFAGALEMIHTYSLIHDDLPAMDDDSFRRGRLTSHKKYGEATAILSGDALLNLAYETMSEAAADAFLKSPEEGRCAVEAMRYIAVSAGSKGMIQGQMLDLSSEGESISLELLTELEKEKTGKLFMAAFAGAALLSGRAKIAGGLEDAGKSLGLAFQIQDDILDETGSLEELGKEPGKDAADQKATFVSLYGLKEAKEAAKKETERCVDALRLLPGEAGEAARGLVRSLLARNS